MFVTAMMAAMLLPLAADPSARTVTVVFVNEAASRTLTVTSPAGRQLVGSFQFGGSLTVMIRVADTNVPVSVSWRAGRLHGTFTITSETADSLRIDLQSSDFNGPYAGGPPPPRRRP
jgi:hypothetical protein